VSACRTPEHEIRAYRQFQNRRRAVRVEQQSAVQRAEAEARGRTGLAPLYTQENMITQQASPYSGFASVAHAGTAELPQLPMPHGQYRQMPVDAAFEGCDTPQVVKREMTSPEKGMY